MISKQTSTQSLHPHDISECTITINNFTLLISNIVYTAPTTFTVFKAWDEMRRSLPLKLQSFPSIVVTNTNLHSPVWNPIHSNTNNKLADDLIEPISKWDLRLRSPVEEPTYGSSFTTTRGTTIDLGWVNKQINDVIQTRLINTDDTTNHFSNNHQSIITSFTTKTHNPETNNHESQHQKNWDKVATPNLLSKLTKSLPNIERLSTQDEIKRFDQNLRKAITGALNNNSPNRSPPGKQKYWCRPEKLDPLRKEAKRQHHRFKKTKTKENKEVYRKFRNLLNKTLDTMKEDSLITYLSTLTHETFFQAKKFTSGRQPSSLVNTLISKSGDTCSTDEEK